MGEAYEPHVVWVRSSRRWCHWIRKGEFPTRFDAETWLKAYCDQRPGSSGVALPVAIGSPVVAMK